MELGPLPSGGAPIELDAALADAVDDVAVALSAEPLDVEQPAHTVTASMAAITKAEIFFPFPMGHSPFHPGFTAIDSCMVQVWPRKLKTT